MNKEKIKKLLDLNKEVDPLTGCWNWKSILVEPYGQLKIKGKNYRAHRLSLFVYTDFNIEDFSSENQALHKCNNKRCFNPEHLYKGTQAQNIADIVRAQNWGNGNKNKKCCIRNHEFTPENTHYYRGKRICKTCKKASSQKQYESSKLREVSE